MYLCVSTHTRLKTHLPISEGHETCQYAVLSQKAFDVKASYIKLFKHNCQHSAVICIVKAACGGEEKRQVHCPHLHPPHPPSSGYLLGSVLEKRAGNLSMIPALRGEGLPGTCFISPTHLSFSVFSPQPPPHPHSSLLPPASLVIQISLLSAHISEAPQFACQLA